MEEGKETLYALGNGYHLLVLANIKQFLSLPSLLLLIAYSVLSSPGNMCLHMYCHGLREYQLFHYQECSDIISCYMENPNNLLDWFMLQNDRWRVTVTGKFHNPIICVDKRA